MSIFDASLVVEDGTGLPGADSYIAVADLRTYCANLNYAIDASVEDAFLETRLRAATNWIDTAFRYKGTKVTATQSLEFPRANLLDWSSMAVTGVPLRVAKACAELAYKAIADVELFQDLERGGLIQHEQIGPISTTYDPNAPAQKVYQQAMGFLEQYVRDMDYLIASPVMGGVDDQNPARPTYFHNDMQRDPYADPGCDWASPLE
jgi:hypothetical protein